MGLKKFETRSGLMMSKGPGLKKFAINNFSGDGTFCTGHVTFCLIF
jgi:hypothetical protein